MSACPSITILDGPVGTELARRGVPTPAPKWSAWAVENDPEAVRRIHAEYVGAGADVLTAVTFRTTDHVWPDRWADMTARAVDLARGAAGPSVRIAGSIAPLEDCYRPDLSPPDPGPEHRMLARALAAAGVDLLLCETFPHTGEALAAAQEAVGTGLETWLSLTAGPRADLLTPRQIGRAATAAAGIGVSAVLVNCIPASRTAEFVFELAGAGVPFGAYANAGNPSEGLGWSDDPDAPKRYADLAERWVDQGASIVGGCCGTGPAHIAELARRFRAR